MARTFHQNLAHLVFSTKNREPLITPMIERELFPYLAATVKNLGGHALEINGMPDHIHLLIRACSTISEADFMREIKSISSIWIKKHIPNFAWQGGYGWFSVSKSQTENVAQYILDQKNHHRTSSFKEEFISFLHKNEIDYDERFILE